MRTLIIINAIAVMFTTAYVNAETILDNSMSQIKKKQMSMYYNQYTGSLQPSKIIKSHVIKEKGPASIWESKNTRTVYIVGLGSPLLTVLDKNQDYSISPPVSIEIGDGAFGVIANLDDSKAFVTNVVNGTVSVVNLKEKRVTSVISLDPNSKPYCEVFSNNEESLYVVSWASESVYVIDPVNLNIKKKIRVGDLSQEFQLNKCYKSCHEEKRGVMQKIIRHKLVMPASTQKIVAMNHMLR